MADLERPDPGKGQAGSYALLVADTYLVPSEEGKPAECLTQAVSRAWNEVAYFFKVGLGLCSGFPSRSFSAFPNFWPSQEVACRPAGLARNCRYSSAPGQACR